jgi:hypothetical protein
VKGVVTAVFIIAIVLASSVILVANIKPMIDENQAYQSLNKAKHLMSELDTIINELVFEAAGSRRSMNFVAESGSLIISGKEDKIKFRMDEAYTDIFEPGTKTEEGNLLIVNGPFIRAYEEDIDNDGSTDLVLENDAVLFAVKKFTDEFINTSTMITRIENKLAGMNITPKGKITIAESEESSYGNGSTELTETGSYILTAGIRLCLNTTTLSYDALFTLGAGQDYVELEIRKIEEN